MSFQSKMSAIREKFYTDVHAEQAIVVEYPKGEKRDEEGRIVEELGTDAEIWARLMIKPIQSIRIEQGTPGRFRYPGLLVVQVFTTLRAGGKKSEDFVDVLVSAYRSKLEDGIIYQKVDIEDIGRDPEGWHQTNVTIPYYYDE